LVDREVRLGALGLVRGIVRVGALDRDRDAGALVVPAVPAPDRDRLRVEVEGSDDEAFVDLVDVDFVDAVDFAREGVVVRDRLAAGARVAAVLDVRLRAGVARAVPDPVVRAGREADPGARRGEPPRPRSSPARVAGTSGRSARREGVLRRVVLTAPLLLPGRVCLRCRWDGRTRQPGPKAGRRSASRRPAPPRPP
jgi:hypothetical protein